MKRMLTIILIAFIFAFTLGGVTTASAEPVNEDTLMTVYGNGTVQLEPDVAYINLGVVTAGSELKDTQSVNDQTMTNVINALKAIGVKDENITTVAYNIYPKYDGKSGTPKLTGYEVRNDISVTITDIDSVGLVIETATAAGANSAGSINFGSSKEDAAYQEALAAGFKDAKAKADALASAAGMSVSSIVSISEGYTSSPALRSSSYYSADEMLTAPIEAGVLTVSATVTVVYSLK